MKHMIIGIMVLTVLSISSPCFSQDFDSVHVYAVYLKSQYRVKIDKDLIKNEVEPIILKGKHQANALYSTLNGSIKKGKASKLTSNQLDIRLLFEFFKQDEVAQTIGLTSYNTIFFDYNLYAYDRSSLKYLDRYIPELSQKLGLK